GAPTVHRAARRKLMFTSREGETSTAGRASDGGLVDDVRMSRWRTPPVTGIALAVVLVLAAAMILRATRGLFFVGDGWHWIESRATPSVSSLLKSFNDHWMTVPIAIHQALYRTVGLRSY